MLNFQVTTFSSKKVYLNIWAPVDEECIITYGLHIIFLLCLSGLTLVKKQMCIFLIFFFFILWLSVMRSGHFFPHNDVK